MRRTLDSLTSRPADSHDEISVTYQAWVIKDQLEAIRNAVRNSNLSWPQWTERALARLEREDEDEIESLLTAWPRGKKGKACLSFRLYPSTLERTQALAEKHGGTIQAVFGHAFCMESMAAGIGQSR